MWVLAPPAQRYFLGGWNLHSVVAYILILTLIPVFKPWQHDVQWELDNDEDAGYDTRLYSKADIVSGVVGGREGVGGGLDVELW